MRRTSEGVGRELVLVRAYHIKDDELLAARYAARDGSFEVWPPQALFKTPPFSLNGFDIAPDGKRFLFRVPLPGQPTSDEIHVRLNGFDELRGSPGEAH